MADDRLKALDAALLNIEKPAGKGAIAPRRQDRPRSK